MWTLSVRSISLGLVLAAVGCTSTADDDVQQSTPSALTGSDSERKMCGTQFSVVGAILQKYRDLGGCQSVLGRPQSEEQVAPDGEGRYTVFEFGSIYWTPDTGAHEVHSAIRSKWADLGWEAGILGYPTSDEIPAQVGGGRLNHFENGDIYWSPLTGPHAVHGRILEGWEEVGKEAGHLGFPTSDEYGVIGGRRSEFQHGAIIWLRASNTLRFIWR